jgi:hypothetical protein
MTANSRFIRARVVSGPTFAGEIAGPKKLSAKDRQIRRKLRRARALKRRIAHLRIRHPLGWKGVVKKAKVNLRVVMSDLRALGWKPKTLFSDLVKVMAESDLELAKLGQV